MHCRPLRFPYLTVRTQSTWDGIVLRTHNIGEADRLCIILTKERGRIAARARGVRKISSRMGSLLLPGRRIAIDIREDGDHRTIVAARLNGEIADLSSPMSLATAQQGIELLLFLTEDDEPLPAVFDVFFQFLHAVTLDAAGALLPFQLRLFHLLGFLPEHGDDRRFALLPDEDKAYVRLCAKQPDFRLLCGAAASPAIRSFAESLLDQHVHRVLKSTAVYSSLVR